MSTPTSLRSSKHWLGFLVAIAGATTAGYCTAGSADENGSPAVIVSFSDLDLSKPAGTRVLYKRITNAARQVCQPLARRDLSLMPLWRDCYAEAVARAVAAINRPNLTALQRSRTGAAENASTIASR
jgi:UrcA family protein